MSEKAGVIRATGNVMGINWPWPSGGGARAGESPAAQPRTVRLRRRPALLDRALLVTIGLTVGLLLHGYVVQSSVVLENSMAPTLIMGDRLLLDKLSPRLGHIRRGDVVVVPAPRDGGLLVKRIVALGGDVVEARGGTLWVNGKPVDEPYAVMGQWYNIPPFPVPQGQAFVLGDNRGGSEDSATWRAGVPVSTILGRAVWLYWPYSHAIPG